MKGMHDDPTKYHISVTRTVRMIMLFEKNIGATPIVSWYHELMMKLSIGCKTWNFRFLTIYISLNPEQDPFIVHLR